MSQMRLTGTDTYDEIRRSVASLVSSHLVARPLATVTESERGYDEQLWKAMRHAGWLSQDILAVRDLDLRAVAMVLSVIGEEACPGPYVQTMSAALMCALLGSGSAAAGVLSEIAEGRPGRVIGPGMGLDEVPRVEVDESGVRWVGRWRGVVEWGHLSGPLVAAVRVGGDSYRLLSMSTAAFEGSKCIDAERAAVLELPSARVWGTSTITEELELGEVRAKLALVALLRAAAMAGGMRRVLAMTTRYVEERYQFGRPLAALQAVQHHLAAIKIEVDAGELSVDKAIESYEMGASYERACWIAAFITGRSYERITGLACQLHGGMGFTQDYPLQYYFRKARAERQRLGTKAFQTGQIRTASQYVDHRPMLSSLSEKVS